MEPHSARDNLAWTANAVHGLLACVRMVRLAVALTAVFWPVYLCAQSFAVFTGTDGGTSHLYRLDLSSLKTSRLTDSAASEMEAAVSPDGNQIAFVSDRDGARALYLAAATPDSPWTRLTAGMGAYAHPTFAPDGANVTAQYVPDPAARVRHTQLVNISLKDKTRTVLVDSAKAFPAEGYDRAVVVDHPAWFDSDLLLFAVVEYSDPDAAPRVTSAGLWRLNARTASVTHLAGGESYYDARGRLHGFKATMPHREGPLIAFVGIQGSTGRVPMVMNQRGRAARILPFTDPAFVGPCLAGARRFLYVIEDGDGNPQLALKSIGETNRRVVPFPGHASEPAVPPRFVP